ncbi:MAG: hypothetical protein L0I24_18005 [Pseudonocardia sp.]|nr:hypothetical protein [Pseudonocardia sp.]
MNTTRLLAFALIVGVTVLVTVWASRGTSSATDFFAAGRGISAGRRTAWPSRVT